MRRPHEWRLACLARAVFSALATLPTSAEAAGDAAPLDLEWSAPEGCPARASVLNDIARLVGPTQGDSPHAPVSAIAVLYRGEDARWHGHITTFGESGGERDLDAPSCSALAEAMALVLALRIKPSLLVPSSVEGGGLPSSVAPAATDDASRSSLATVPAVSPEAPPARSPPVAPAIPPARPPVLASPGSSTAPPELVAATANLSPHPLFVGASLLGSVGELPSADLRPEIRAGYVGGRFRLEAHAETGLVQHASTPASPAGGSVLAAGGGLRGCYAPIARRASVFACADGEIDERWVSGYGSPKPLDQNAGWITLGAGVGATYRFSSRFALRGDLEGLVPLSRPRFVTEDYLGNQVGVVYRPAPLWGRVGLGAEFFFF